MKIQCVTIVFLCGGSYQEMGHKATLKLARKNIQSILCSQQTPSTNNVFFFSLWTLTPSFFHHSPSQCPLNNAARSSPSANTTNTCSHAFCWDTGLTPVKRFRDFSLGGGSRSRVNVKIHNSGVFLNLKKACQEQGERRWDDKQGSLRSTCTGNKPQARARPLSFWSTRLGPPPAFMSTQADWLHFTTFKHPRAFRVTLTTSWFKCFDSFVPPYPHLWWLLCSGWEINLLIQVERKTFSRPKSHFKKEF